jgi:XTP/dITP diphosphohydrolase
MKTLLYATTNDYKLFAANTALQAHEVTLQKLPVGVPEIMEIQTDSQEEVAIDKARKYFALLKKPLVAMDFGFFVEGLNGFPGVYTKYAADTIGVDGLVNLVRNLKDRSAYTERTIIYTDGIISKSFSCRCPGTILLEPRGESGRGYDTLFCVNETGKTLAEMSEEEKAKISGDTWKRLGVWLQDSE